MTSGRRGEIWLLDLAEPVGNAQGFRRPALVVSSDQWNTHASTLAVLPITRTKHNFPTRVEIEPDAHNGLDAVCYARCEDVRSISEGRLVRRLGQVDLITMTSVARVMKIFFEI